MFGFPRFYPELHTLWTFFGLITLALHILDFDTPSWALLVSAFGLDLQTGMWVESLCVREAEMTINYVEYIYTNHLLKFYMSLYGTVINILFSNMLFIRITYSFLNIFKKLFGNAIYRESFLNIFKKLYR